MVCFNTQPPEGGWDGRAQIRIRDVVSTHSRPKAAGKLVEMRRFMLDCFNTQPPEGGWFYYALVLSTCSGFNTQPPEGGWLPPYPPKLTAACFNTQPPEGGWHRSR